MEGTVFVRRYDAPPASLEEAARYARCPVLTEELRVLLEQLRQELAGQLSCALCHCRLSIPEEGAISGFTPEDSEKIRRALPGCHAMILFAATLGLGPDRLLSRYGTLSPARALLMQALATAQVEALCDAFCREIRQEQARQGLFTLPRFSPGYGDLPLTLQKDIFRILRCPEKIGLTLNESLLMSPSKSVTAFVGIRACAAPDHPGGCGSCGKTDCPYRRSL